MLRNLLVALGAAAVLGCPASPPPPEPVPPPLPVPDAQPGEGAVTAPFSPATEEEWRVLVQDSDRFAARLYGELARQAGNFAASPASIYLAMGMTYAGANGTTAAEMSQALSFSLGADTTHRAFGTMLRAWAPRPDAEFDLVVANRLFGAEGVNFGKGFLGTTADHYQAPLQKLDFAGDAEAARLRINGWVGDQTRQRIKYLLPEGSIKPATTLVLANAIYFNGTWVEKFVEGDTKAEAFHASGGDVTTPTMHTDKRLTFFEGDGVKVLTLMYRGTSIAMSFVLPDAVDGLASAEKGFREGRLAGWVKASKIAKVKVALPKFKLEGAALSLSAALTALGMGSAFDEQRADFSGMASGASPRLFLGDVFHKAYVDVHERGTEAAGSSGVIMYPISMPPPAETREFIADHPFLFFIHETQYGGVLFMGRVVNPTKTT